jgi:hypothetical protein
MILAPTLTLSAGSGAAIVRPTFSRDFAGEKTLNNGTGPAITFTRASNATYFDANGVLQTAANDAPRFDHDPATGESRGLLIEEARTNLLLNSATLATQSVTVSDATYTLSFYGTGQVVLSGAHSATVTGSGAFPTRTTLTFAANAGSLTATVSGTVEYAQLEAKSFATSYITTTGASATRSADSAAVTPISSFYNQAGGTLFAEIRMQVVSSPRTFVSLDSSSVTRTTLLCGTLLNGALFVRNAGFTQASLNAGSIANNSTTRIAGAYALNSFGLSNNGSAVAEDLSGTVPTGINRLSLGFYHGASDGFLNGHIRKIAYWPKRLSNTLLQQLTT